jgi:hypothetical protein
MASPAVAATNTTNGSTASQNKTVNLPASIAVNNLLLLCLRTAGADTHTTPTDWNVLFLNDASDGSDDVTSLWWKRAVAADVGVGSIIVTCTANLKFAALSWRITGHVNPDERPPEFATLVTGSSTIPDPGTVTPTGGSKDYLFLWLGGWAGEQTSPPASNPTNYASNVIGANSGTASTAPTNCRLASASRQATGSSENPGTWTISVTDFWTATVVAIHPADIVTAQHLPPASALMGAGGFVGSVYR